MPLACKKQQNSLHCTEENEHKRQRAYDDALGFVWLRLSWVSTAKHNTCSTRRSAEVPPAGTTARIERLEHESQKNNISSDTHKRRVNQAPRHT